ncbi:hypothetical protein AB0I02_27180 [Streptomyces phaeochromogenes]
MPVDLTVPLSWKGASGDADAMLDDLQSNILKPCVREHLHILLLGFTDSPEARAFLNALASKVKPVSTHLREVDTFKSGGVGGTPYVGVGLTHAGYGKLGLSAQAPADPSFRRGMRDAQTQQDLSDPAVPEWEEPYREEIHAVVLVGDASATAATAEYQLVKELLPPSVRLIGEETGLGMRNADGDGIEHFGYVDGRSQPLFLTEDVDDERRSTDGTSVWNPATALDRVLVADPPASGEVIGSYFVLRKLEQNVRVFRQAEEELANELKLVGSDRDRAGAMVVGRFRDGTPVTLQSAAGPHSPVMNNFDYASDDQAVKCPFQGHIRKTNPRGSGGFEPPENEREHLMARRGQTYGERKDDPTGRDVPLNYRPTGGVGLLFMAFNSDLGNQFEFTQQRWANGSGFPKVPTGTPEPGLDLVIGQGSRPAAVWPLNWGEQGTGPGLGTPAFPQAVTMKGGEYFFMPLLSFLRSLSPTTANTATGI